MDIRTSFAAQTYAQARSATQPSSNTADAAGGFAQALGGLADTLKAGEATARSAMTGGADPHALVEALAASELAVETAVTLRDKVVEAYQEILRMPV
ncbi:MAG: flagellar hook-basal body complex protein FliE [Albidovulum sp.]|jgi:flagellar hook-basal body complex protein FliE|uniref:flagellar hook-basal body complex protein FliE n=1 Tax=Albidovulum sp. TaxID=1872424 RepID=UPI0013253D35|nr:flagellar hook-basal body complex protein FliE [Defluviimonas sp.]KAB2886076.1 MAG: flagellar hook-basal body complex protein FliE [Defluviimonas sp.]